MVSKQCIQIMGLQVNVFGLEEYRKLPSNTPLAVMFGLHGKLYDQRQLDKSCQALCGINEKRRRMDRYIIAVTFDCTNHGTRLAYKEDMNIQKLAYREQTRFAFDLYLAAVETSRIITQLIDVFELYVFGPNHRHPVEKWGGMAFSLGAHALYMTVGKDPRISTVITIAGAPDLISLIKVYYSIVQAEKDFDIRTEYYEWAYRFQKDIIKRLDNTKVLAMYGDNDEVVKSIIGEKLTKSLRSNHSGRENQDWKVLTLPETGHYIGKKSISEAVDWTSRWMVRREPELTAKL